MDIAAILTEFGWVGGVAIIEAFVIYYLVGWIRQLVEARQRDAEKFGDRAVEREREITGTIKDLTHTIKAGHDVRL